MDTVFQYIPVRKMCQLKANVHRTQQQLLQLFHDVLSDESGDDSISRKLRRYEEKYDNKVITIEAFSDWLKKS